MAKVYDEGIRLPPEYRWNLKRSHVKRTEHGKPYRFSSPMVNLSRLTARKAEIPRG